MMRSIKAAGIAAISCGVLAAGAFAANEAKPNNVAAKQCQAEKKAVGNKAFKDLYGGKQAMQQCKRANRGEAKQAIATAKSDCRAERDEIGEEAFAERYGTNKNGRNAFGKCVSQSVSESGDEESEDEETEDEGAEEETEPETAPVS